MKHSVSHWVCLFALVALPVVGCGDENTAAGGSSGTGGSAGAGGGGTGGEVAADIAKARAATERYKSLENAIDDGYEESGILPCVAHNGWRFANFAHFVLAQVNPPDIEKPVNLVYDRQQDGSFTLVAVEYVTSGTSEAPTLFGQKMDGLICLPNDFPPSYALHVWLWKDNPDGMFQHYNSTVSADVCVADGEDRGVPFPPYCETGIPPAPPWL